MCGRRGGIGWLLAAEQAAGAAGSRWPWLSVDATLAKQGPLACLCTRAGTSTLVLGCGGSLGAEALLPLFGMFVSPRHQRGRWARQLGPGPGQQRPRTAAAGLFSQMVPSSVTAATCCAPAPLPLSARMRGGMASESSITDTSPLTCGTGGGGEGRWAAEQARTRLEAKGALESCAQSARWSSAAMRRRLAGCCGAGAAPGQHQGRGAAGGW
jgi:hypothetical protein